MEELKTWTEQQDVVAVRVIKQGEEDKFILTLGEYNVSPIVFDTQEEAEKFLKEHFKFNNFELSVIGAMCLQLNKLEQREKESYLTAKENALKNN